MVKHYRMSAHDLTGKRLCVLYDSDVDQKGAATEIKITKQLDGWKELEFTLDVNDTDGERNWRCDYINNENLIYMEEGDEIDIYCIKTPQLTVNKSGASWSVKCNHSAEELKTRNIYKYFDDDNGIGTCQELIAKALEGSGWTLGAYDTFYEADGTTEKIRSYSCDTKTGAYNMVSGICDLFQARPVFHSIERVVDIFSVNNTVGCMEVLFGKNSDKIQRKLDSTNLVTRLYVEGQYIEGDYDETTDFGYLGIETVNPTGMPFIFNFDYYKELGYFTDEHQAIVDEYIINYKDARDRAAKALADLVEKQTICYGNIGVLSYVYYVVEDDVITDIRYAGATMRDEDIPLLDGDDVMLINPDGSYTHETYEDRISVTGKIGVLKVVPVMTGKLAQYEDMIKANDAAIDVALEKVNKFLRTYEEILIDDWTKVTVDDLKETYGTNDLSVIKHTETGIPEGADLALLDEHTLEELENWQDEWFDISGVDDAYKQQSILDLCQAIGLYEHAQHEYERMLREAMLRSINAIVLSDEKMNIYNTQKQRIVDVENQFVSDMGFMLRDGYWSDDKYVPGQEESLYADSVEMLEKLSRPVVSYSVSISNLAMLTEHRFEDFYVAQTIHIYDEYTCINDFGVTTKMVSYPQKPQSDTVTIETDLLDIANKSFNSIFERITEAANQTRLNKEIYQRAASLSKDGTLRSEMLAGAINVNQNRLMSASSNWQTDDKGNILFLSLDGTSAMMLCGGGFMIANSKNPDGSWQWRTFGTGDGFAADMIVTGYMSGERVEAGSITTNQLNSSVGSELDISSNTAISLLAADIDDLEERIETAEIKITPEAIISTVTESEEFTEVKQEADKIAWIVSNGSTQSEIILTQNMLEAIADDVNLSANHTMTFDATQLNQIANDINLSANDTIVIYSANQITVDAASNIDLSANHTMTFSAEQLAAIAEDIDLSANHSMTFNTDQLAMIANDIDLTVNDGFAVQSQRVADAREDIDKLQEKTDELSDDISNMEQWMEFDKQRGLIIHAVYTDEHGVDQVSEWETITDSESYVIQHRGESEAVFEARKDMVEARNLQLNLRNQSSDPIRARASARGGWIWVKGVR